MFMMLQTRTDIEAIHVPNLSDKPDSFDFLHTETEKNTRHFDSFRSISNR